MKKHKKLFLTKVNIASVNDLQNIKGGNTIPTHPANTCISEETAVEATCSTITEGSNCNTGTTRACTI